MRTTAALFFVFISACSPAQSLPLPASPTQVITEPAVATATDIAEGTRTATDNAEDLALLDLQYPAQGHLIVSIAVPNESPSLRAAIRNQRGELLARQLTSTQGEAEVSIDLYFAQEGEELYLVLSSEDRQKRETEAVSVLLIFDGFGTLLAADSIATIELSTPEVGDRLAADSLMISGSVAWEQPRAINVQLVNRDGRVLISRDVYQSEGGVFAIELDPQISEAQWVQVVASQSLAGFTLTLDGFEVWLEP